MSVERSGKQLSSRPSFGLFFNLIALTLDETSVKTLGFIKIVKEIKFEGVWDELESKKSF